MQKIINIFYTMRNIKQNARMDKKTCILSFTILIHKKFRTKATLPYGMISMKFYISTHTCPFRFCI